MKKLLVSILLLGLHGTTKPMGSAAVLGAGISAAPTLLCAYHDLACGSGHVVDRFNRSCAWIVRGCAMGAYAGFVIAPLIACGDMVPMQCTESSVFFATTILTTLAAMENGIRYTNAILKHSNSKG
jgi:hypothetical protein